MTDWNASMYGADMASQVKAMIDFATGGSVTIEGASAANSTLGYNSHLLLAQAHSGGATVVMRWERAPTQAEIDKRRDEFPKGAYSSFVLVRPCGPVMDGNCDVSA